MSIHISLSSVTSLSAVAPNAFKGPDGLLNFDAVFKLNTRVQSAIKTVAAKTGSAVPVSEYYVVAVKAKPIKYSVSLEKKDDLKYHTRRATKIAIRKRLAAGSEARVTVVLTIIDKKSGVPLALVAQVKEAQKAILAHMKKAVKSKEVITKKRGKIRDASNESFEASVGHLKEILLAGGIKEDAIVESSGMFGKSVLVKLTSEYVVSIGKADIARFNAARKAARTATV